MEAAFHMLCGNQYQNTNRLVAMIWRMHTIVESTAELAFQYRKSTEAKGFTFRGNNNELY